MEETRDDVVAIVGTRYGGQMYGSVVDMAAVQQLCHELHGEAEHEDPKSREGRKRSQDFGRSNVRRRRHRSG